MTTTNKNRRSRRTPAALACGLLLGGAVLGSPRPAEAAILPAVVTEVVSFFTTAFSYYKQLNELLGDEAAPGPDLAQLIRDLQTDVIGEMRSQRNLALKSQTRTVLNLFTDLADNAPADPTNPSMWTDIRGRQQETADAMFDIITNTGDAESAYQLAPAYNVLITTGTGLLKIKSQLWPRTPASWNDHYAWLQPGIAADYTMIGSQRHKCYPGYNPGFSPRPSPFHPNYPRWEAQTAPGKYRESLLWTKKIANTYYTVATFPCGARICNPGSTHCYTSGTICSGGGTATNACNYQLSDLDCAAKLAKPTFDADPVVKVIRGAMLGIQKVSGGNDYDWASNDSLTEEGKLVDPWVYEPSCDEAGPYAYPWQP
jgi:hypothetical protein